VGLAAGLCLAPVAQADMFGGDVVVLLKILAEQIKQYYQLKNIIQNGKGQLDLLRQVNQGIDNSVELIRTLPIKDERVLAEITRFQQGINRVFGCLRGRFG
jgi:hypothetical protein